MIFKKLFGKSLNICNFQKKMRIQMFMKLKKNVHDSEKIFWKS